MGKYVTVVKKSRFVVPGFGPSVMQRIGEKVRASIDSRIAAGVTVYDSPAPPLSVKRAAYKQRTGRAPIRDWWYTGWTRRGMKVASVGQGEVSVGFVDAMSDFRATMNNRRSLQFGASPKDLKVFERAYTSEVQQQTAVAQSA
jgi:hypothetical protein